MIQNNYNKYAFHTTGKQAFNSQKGTTTESDSFYCPALFGAYMFFYTVNSQ